MSWKVEYYEFSDTWDVIQDGILLENYDTPEEAVERVKREIGL